MSTQEKACFDMWVYPHPHPHQVSEQEQEQEPCSSVDSIFGLACSVTKKHQVHISEDEHFRFEWREVEPLVLPSPEDIMNYSGGLF